jgi:hypothetical protein
MRNFRRQTPVTAGQVLTALPVRGRPRLTAQLIAATGFTHVFPRSLPVRTVIEAPRLITGPRPAHQVVGSVVVLAGGAPVARIPLALAQAVPPPARSLVSRPSTLIAIALLLVASVALIVLGRQRVRVGRARQKRPA